MNSLKKVLFIFFLFLFIFKTEESHSQNVNCPIKDSIHINNQVWMTKNLDVCTFQNGDSILYASSLGEWVEAGKKGIPAWCYYENNPELGKHIGKIYNWYAAADERELAPSGWRIPTEEDFKKFIVFIGTDFYNTSRLASKEWKGVAGTDSYGFSATPDGYRLISLNDIITSPDTIMYNSRTRFGGLGFGVGYWSSTSLKMDSKDGCAFLLNIQEEANIYGVEKIDGLYIRCILNE